MGEKAHPPYVYYVRFCIYGGTNGYHCLIMINEKKV